ncbi:hemK methyltransferase family member 2-like isoform x2, partial [Plakobranchus ocellatus]
PCVCIEVGCGSGICITYLAQILDNNAVFFCTDINPKAVEMTKATAKRNNRAVEPVLCNLVNAESIACFPSMKHTIYLNKILYLQCVTPYKNFCGKT